MFEIGRSHHSELVAGTALGCQRTLFVWLKTPNTSRHISGGKTGSWINRHIQRFCESHSDTEMTPYPSSILPLDESVTRGRICGGDQYKHPHSCCAILSFSGPTSPTGSSMSSSDDGHGAGSILFQGHDFPDEASSQVHRCNEQRSASLPLPCVPLMSSQLNDTGCPVLMTSSPTSTSSDGYSTSPSPESSVAGSINAPSCYPVRTGVLDCQYYLKTGKCNYGSRCKFNHPHRDEKLVSALNRRDCFDFVQTGTCPYGKTCKYNHPPRTDEANVAPASSDKKRRMSDTMRSTLSNDTSGVIPVPNAKYQYPTWPNVCNQSRDYQMRHQLPQHQQRILDSSMSAMSTSMTQSYPAVRSCGHQIYAHYQPMSCIHEQFAALTVSSEHVRWSREQSGYQCCHREGSRLACTSSPIGATADTVDVEQFSHNNSIACPVRSAGSDYLWSRRETASNLSAWHSDLRSVSQRASAWTQDVSSERKVCGNGLTDSDLQPWISPDVSLFSLGKAEGSRNKVSAKNGDYEKSYMPFATAYGSSVFTSGAGTWAATASGAESLFDELSDARQG